MMDPHTALCGDVILAVSTLSDDLWNSLGQNIPAPQQQPRLPAPPNLPRVNQAPFPAPDIVPPPQVNIPNWGCFLEALTANAKVAKSTAAEHEMEMMFQDILVKHQVMFAEAKATPTGLQVIPATVIFAFTAVISKRKEASAQNALMNLLEAGAVDPGLVTQPVPVQ